MAMGLQPSAAFQNNNIQSEQYSEAARALRLLVSL